MARLYLINNANSTYLVWNIVLLWNSTNPKSAASPNDFGFYRLPDRFFERLQDSGPTWDEEVRQGALIDAPKTPKVNRFQRFRGLFLFVRGLRFLVVRNFRRAGMTQFPFMPRPIRHRRFR
ncbi:MAG TPA: hypothetical protein DCE44_24110 [Verrucomicrobiales bacterium]|nr:hypothetical protein [Verrucomicrobiales bacterium]